MVPLKRLSITLALVVMSVWAGPSIAQSVSSLVATCEKLAENPDMEDTEDALAALTATKYVRSSDFVERGEACLTAALGEQMTYVYGSGFLDEEEFAALQRQEEAEAERRRAYKAEVSARECELIDEYIALGMTLPALEATEQARRSNAVRQTVAECDAWLLEDERAALTNPVCSDLFLDIGLPEDRDAGAGASVSATERELEAILEQLEIIRTHRRLPEDYWQDQQEQTLAEFRETKEELGCDS